MEDVLAFCFIAYLTFYEFSGSLIFREDEAAGVVGHIPYELSALIKEALTSHNIKLTLTVIDETFHRSDKAAGLIIRCRYSFEGDVVRVTRLLNSITDIIRRQRELNQQLQLL